MKYDFKYIFSKEVLSFNHQLAIGHSFSYKNKLFKIKEIIHFEKEERQPTYHSIHAEYVGDLNNE